MLTTLLPGRPSLSPMTALLLVVGAAAVAALPARRTLALRLACAEIGCGIGIVVAHLAHIPEQAWMPLAWWSSRLTGMAFAFSGASTLLLASGRLTGGQVLAFVVLLLAALLGMGHVFPSADLYALLPGTGVAIPTVVAFIALSVGQLLTFAQTGVSAALTSRNAAGRMGLGLLLAGVAAALMLTVAVLAALRHGLFDPVTAVLLLAWALIALLGSALWSLAVAVDRAELAKIAAERESNEMRRMVAAAVTHDLRSPLQAATLSGQLLERLVADAPALAAIARLQRSHRRLDRLFRTLLDSLVVGSGQQLTFHPSHFTLQDLVREVVAENEAMLARRLACEGGAEGCWDRDALFRVIENLLLNAVKYGEPGTTISCRSAPKPAGVSSSPSPTAAHPSPRPNGKASSRRSRARMRRANPVRWVGAWAWPMHAPWRRATAATCASPSPGRRAPCSNSRFRWTAARGSPPRPWREGPWLSSRA